MPPNSAFPKDLQADRSPLAAHPLTRQMLLLNPSPLLALDANGERVLDANDAATGLYGLPREQLIGTKFVAAFRQPEEVREAIAARQAHLALHYLAVAEGRHLPVEISIRYLPEVGVPLVYLHDLSEKLALDNQCMIAERNYRLLFEHAPQPMLLIDTNFVVVSANPAAVSLYGFAAGDLGALNLKAMLVHPRDLSHYRVQLQPRTLPAQWHWLADGRQRLLEARVSTLRRNRQSRLLVVLHDVTESEAKLAELRRAEERWRFALGGHGDGVWEWLPNTGEALVSERFLEMLGFPPEDATRSFNYWDARVHPDDYQRMHLEIMRHFFAESPVIAGEYRMMTIDGQYRWLAIRARAIETDAAGRLERIIGSVRDIHEQRRQEHRERMQQEQLMHTARLATMGELVTMIAHEITQPLTAISNFSAAGRRHLERAACPTEHEEALRAFRRIGELVGHTGEVVHRIRSFVRKGEIKLEAVRINEVIVEVARLAEIQARSLGADLELELGANLPTLTADRMQIGQMLLNLARNGLEAMAAVEGRRQLKIRSRLNSQNEIEVEIEDCGCGLSAAMAMDVFSPFFTTKPDGLGIGLAICNTVVENHGGRLWASAVKPSGTVFHVGLPVR